MSEKERLEDIINQRNHIQRDYYDGVPVLGLLDTNWLIKQAEQLEKIKKLSNAEDITLADFAKEVLQIIECREIQARKSRS